jgi:hypothetical protein
MKSVVVVEGAKRSKWPRDRSHLARAYLLDLLLVMGELKREKNKKLKK